MPRSERSLRFPRSGNALGKRGSHLANDPMEINMKLKPLTIVSILAIVLCPQFSTSALTGGPIELHRFPVATWINITPPMIVTGRPETCIGQGLALDFRNPGTIYWTNAPYETSEGNGLFKSTNYGATWRRIASVRRAYPGASNYLDMPLHIRIDPADPRTISTLAMECAEARKASLFRGMVESCS